MGYHGVVGVSLSIGDDMEDITKRYKAYIHSRAWHGTREEVFRTRGRECVYCLAWNPPDVVREYLRTGDERLKKEAVINSICFSPGIHKDASPIHHSGYETYATENYKLSLFPSCRDCHDEMHDIDKWKPIPRLIRLGKTVVAVKISRYANMDWISDYRYNPEQMYFSKWG